MLGNKQMTDYSGEEKGPGVFDVGPSPLVWGPFLWAVDAIEWVLAAAENWPDGAVFSFLKLSINHLNQTE